MIGKKLFLLISLNPLKKRENVTCFLQTDRKVLKETENIESLSLDQIAVQYLNAASNIYYFNWSHQVIIDQKL